MAHRVTLVANNWQSSDLIAPLDGLLGRLGVKIEWERHDGESEEALKGLVFSASKTGVVLMGPRKTPEGERPLSVQIRKGLGLFAQVRHVKNVHGLPARHDGVDLLVVREISEDLYTGIEHESAPGVYESIKLTTKAACERIARFAFEEARRGRRKKLTIVHKSNIMKLSDGLLLRTATEVSKRYPEIETEEVIVDALCMKLVRDPNQFEVLLCGNLFGDIVSDLAAGLAGGSLSGGTVSHGDGIALFESGSCDGECDPTALLFEAVKLLRHLGEDEAGLELAVALAETLKSGVRSKAGGGDASTAELFKGVSDRL